MCREYCVSTPLVLFVPVADGGTIGLRWRTKYWKHLVKINTSKLDQILYKLHSPQLMRYVLN